MSSVAKNGPSHAGATFQETHFAWVVSLAQECEHVWNERGRAAAKARAEDALIHGLRRALKEGGGLVKSKALYVLSLWPSTEVIGDFRAVLKDDACPVVRHEAAYFLGTMRELEAVTALGEALVTDPDELVRHEAAEAIGELGMASGLRWLAEAEHDRSQLVRRTVVIASENIMRRMPPE